MWRSVPKEFRKKWNDALIPSYEHGPEPACICPVCARGVLRIFYVRFDDDFSQQSSRGGGWFWCPVCFSFEHATVIVPVWWVDVSGIDLTLLTPEPEWLNQNWDSIIGANGLSKSD